MQIHCLGLNHKAASVALRERLAFSQEQIDIALARLGCGNGSAPHSIHEMVILSTCNRVEIYAVAPGPAFDVLEGFLEEVKGVPREEFHEVVYRLAGSTAVEHLLKVAAGLDSLVLGEPQILGQVTQAFSKARSQGTARKILSRLFQTAIHAGKRARTETAIGHNPASIASVAVRLISDTVPDLAASQVMVLGAGEMAELAVDALMKRGSRSIWVVNRTLERARVLAERWDGAAFSYESLSELLPRVDILITSTGAPHTLIAPQMVTQALEKRPDKPMAIMDIAVPRDVDTRVADIPGASLFDMDNLSERLESSLDERAKQVPKVKEILAEEQAGFMDYIDSLDVVPLIISMHEQANKIRQSELKKSLRRMPDLSQEQTAHITYLTESIVKKILHNPIICLRNEAGGPKSADYTNIARTLFGIGKRE